MFVNSVYELPMPVASNCQVTNTEISLSKQNSPYPIPLSLSAKNVAEMLR